MSHLTELSTEEMLRELTVVFPTLWKRPLGDFGGSFGRDGGVWTVADGDVLPGGDPIFNTLAHGGDDGSPYRNPPVHAAFEAWLSNRGWAWENYDGATIFLLPLSAFDAPDRGQTGGAP